MGLIKVIQLSFLISVAVLGFTACTDPFNFSEEKIKEAEIIIDCSRCSALENPQPLIVINEQIMGQDSLKNLNPEYVQSISVLKGPKAINLYGSAAENGVVQIQTDQKIFSAK